GDLDVAQLAAEGLAEAVHARAGAGEVGAVAVQPGLDELLGAEVVTAAAAAAGIAAADAPVGRELPAQAEVQAPGLDVVLALAGQPHHLGPVVERGAAAAVEEVAVGIEAEPGQLAGVALVQLVDALAGIGQVAAVVAVVQVGADPVTGSPLVGDVAVQVQAVLVFRGQVVEIGAVLGEALGDAQVGGQQGGVEGPGQRLDVAVAPGTIVAAQALAAEAQVFAGVGGEPGVADPELAHGQVVLVALAGVAVAGGVQLVVDGVRLDGVGGGHRLGHGEGAPVAALAEQPGPQVEAEALHVAAAARAEVAVVLGLAGDLHFQAEIPVRRAGGPGRAAAE